MVAVKAFLFSKLQCGGLPSRVQIHVKNNLLRRNVKRFRGGLVSKAHRLECHSTLGLRVVKKKKTRSAFPAG